MIHARIIKDPGPFHGTADEASGRGVERSGSADQDYFRQRADQEATAAQAATCCEARLAHEELAAAYRKLCVANGDQISIDPDSESCSSTLSLQPLH